MRAAAVVVVGLVVGALLSDGTTHLGGMFRPMSDAAASWLIPAWLLGALMRTRRGAVLAGLGCALVQLGSSSATTALRGVPMQPHLVCFWIACSLVGGPLFGACGHLARRGDPPRRGLGIAVLAALFIVEGIWSDWHLLRAGAAGWLWLGIGVVLAATLAGAWERIRWVALTLPLAFVAELALTQIHR